MVSQPEYVAGLQFDTVIIVDANENLVPRGMDSQLQLRRFLSNLYLGMSRAERVLEVYATDDAGGLTRHLESARRGGLVQLERIGR